MVVGGYVRCIAEAIRDKEDNHNLFRLGYIYKISEIRESSGYIITSEGYKLMFRDGSFYNTECEYIGLNPNTIYELW